MAATQQSMSGLFADSSDESDSDDDKNNNHNNNNENVSASAPNAAAATTNAAADSSSDDDDDDDDDDGDKEKKEDENDQQNDNAENNENDNINNNKEGDENENEEPKSTEEEETTTTKTAADLGLEDSSSDDDDDAEFEDDGITGGKSSSSTPKPPSRPANDHIMNRIREEDSDEEVGVGGGVEESPSRGMSARRSALPPRNLSVLDLPHPTPSSSGNNKTKKKKPTLHMTKLPNLLGINPDAFNPQTYDADLEDKEYRGYVHNMIRWRYKMHNGKLARSNNNGEEEEEGLLMRESNARFVKWSDGSCTIHVGNEAFEVDNIDSRNKKSGFPGLNGYLYLSQKASVTSDSKEDDDDDDDNDDDDEEEKKKSGGTVLECVGTIESKMTARPSSLQSEAHKKLTLAVRQRNMKKARIAEYVTQVDPEKEKNERIKNKEDLNRQTERGMRRSAGTGVRRYRNPNMSKRYLEEDDGNYDSVSIGGLKRRTMGMDDDDDDDDMYDDIGRDGGRLGGRYNNNDSEDEYDDWSSRKKFQKNAAVRNKQSRSGGSTNNKGRGKKDDDSFIVDDDEDVEEEMFGEESSDEEEDMVRNKGRGSLGKKRARENMFGEDDEDESDDD